MSMGHVAPKKKIPASLPPATTGTDEAAVNKEPSTRNKRAQPSASLSEPAIDGSEVLVLTGALTDLRKAASNHQSAQLKLLQMMPPLSNILTAQDSDENKIVFTDDEDAGESPITLASNNASSKADDLAVADDGGEQTFEVVGEIDPDREESSDFIDDTAQEGEEYGEASDRGEHLDDAEEDAYVEARDQGVGTVGTARPIDVEQRLAKMEAGRQAYIRAKKDSVELVARTNPGDGTKRLYGEDTYIHDNIIGSTASSVKFQTPSTSAKGVIGGVKGSGVCRVKPGAASATDRDPVTPIKNDRGKAKANALSKPDDLKFLSDTEPRGQSGPTNCEVLNVDDMDAIINYDDLPPLFAGKFLESWSTLPGPGLAVVSAWHEEIPDISMSQVRNCIEFERFEHMYNPSRMTPSDMGLAPFPGNSYIVPGGTTQPATLTTLVLVTSCNIHSMKSVFGEDRRMISGIPHITEGPRMESAILMTYHLDKAHAQISQQSITFSTARTMGSALSSPVKNPSKMFRRPAGASASNVSPFAKSLANIQGSGYVPVLDARRTRFSLRDKLDRLDTILPPFNAKVPEGSCAWVGYTVNKYTTIKGNHLNFNLLWVVVLGTPE
ncbi:hypothetical protein HWV62_4910 [Athelia sp. TMB]|nr:hypothetical protein HWV62_4910 [Athelia sp. TMB]